MYEVCGQLCVFSNDISKEAVGETDVEILIPILDELPMPEEEELQVLLQVYVPNLEGAVVVVAAAAVELRPFYEIGWRLPKLEHRLQLPN